LDAGEVPRHGVGLDVLVQLGGNEFDGAERHSQQ